MIRPTLFFCIALALQLGAAVEECDDNSIGKTLQDPEDCHGYYLCHSGHKLQQYCAPGMKYVPQLGNCVVGKCPPCNCAVDPTSTTTPEPTESTTDSSTAASTESTDSSTNAPTTTTPEPTDSSTVTTTTTSEPTESTDSSTNAPSTTTPEPTDSSTVTTTTTPEPTESSTDSSTAVSTTTTPEPTESSTDSSTAVSTTTTPDPTPQPSESTSASEDPTSTSIPRPPVSCENIRDGSFFRDPVHCRDYYVCRNRQPVLLHCEKGMWFDDINFVCNFPRLVDCPANID